MLQLLFQQVLGLSSLGSCEAHVLPSLLALDRALSSLLVSSSSGSAAPRAAGATKGQEELTRKWTGREAAAAAMGGWRSRAETTAEKGGESRAAATGSSNNGSGSADAGRRGRSSWSDMYNRRGKSSTGTVDGAGGGGGSWAGATPEAFREGREVLERRADDGARALRRVLVSKRFPAPLQ